MSNKCFCHLTVNGESYEVKDSYARQLLNNYALTDQRLQEEIIAVRESAESVQANINNIYAVIASFHTWNLVSTSTINLDGSEDSGTYGEIDLSQILSTYANRDGYVIKIVATLLNTSSTDYALGINFYKNEVSDDGTEMYNQLGEQVTGKSATLLLVSEAGTAITYGGNVWIGGEPAIYQNGGQLQVQIYTKGV